MKVDGIDYGLGAPWEIDVPDDSIVIENTEESRIPPALADVPQAVRDAIRNPMGTAPLADQVNSSSKVALILNDWMGVSVHAVPVVLEERVTIGARLTHFLRAIVSTGNGGLVTARLTGPQGSGILTSMSRANALLVVPEDRPVVEAGETLHALPLGDAASLTIQFSL